MSKRSKFFWGSVLTVGLLTGAAGTLAFRAHRVWNVAKDMRAQLRYLTAGDETIGEVPASDAFDADYLKSIFGEDPELFHQLRTVVAKGLEETPVLNLGEVSAMMVTHRKGDDGQPRDVVVHVMGGFPPDARKIGFHRDGYMKKMVDSHLWDAGNIALGVLGRDMVLFAQEETIGPHQELIAAIFRGDIMPLVESLDDPIYFTLVFPDPQHIVPPQLKRHIQAVIMKGYLGQKDGKTDVIFLTPSARSARYAFSILQDLKTAAELALQVKWNGVKTPDRWRAEPTVQCWWAYEIVQNSKASTFEREAGIIRLSSSYGRVMNNAVLKIIERFGRDARQMQLAYAPQTEPVGDDEKAYWSLTHHWGPDWPVGSDGMIVAGAPATEPAPAEPAAVEPAPAEPADAEVPADEGPAAAQ
ncbi:MAG TPA: hypothetical protein PKM67_05565 [Kiritimatiellia bacterium]|nr:hypothetical protein [Kiritimatiellia bacterium]HNS80906.1 hypothetical protein [Kiritimatiellia bacterium]HPA77398.1 hypothetical protein [Kiritimatiellia bacterium]HQQ03505.1 hypothetical protein [Kiritimatiellia bacterium]